MDGFIVTCCKNSENELMKPHSIKPITLNKFTYFIKSKNCQIIHLANDELMIIDGYNFQNDFSTVVSAVCKNKFSLLNQIEGHFSGIYINQQGIIGFNDRYGGKTLFWQKHQHNLIISSRISLMPYYDTSNDPKGAYESALYRWTTGEQTLLAKVHKLMAHHSIKLDPEFRETTQSQSYWQLPLPQIVNTSIETKIAQTKTILTNRLKEASRHHKKVAIFLSGGVDSSILAALSKDIFEKCYLITPIFKGEANPELATAKAFAKTLNLTHHFIEIDPEFLEVDLKQLIKLKGEPLRHYSSLAMMAMMKAIPQEYDAVIYGEAADTLFGSNGIKRILTHYNWKKKSQFIPNFILTLLAKLTPTRGNILLNVNKKTLRELILSVTQIKYSPEQRKIIASLFLNEESQLDHWLWQGDVNSITALELRHAAQERILNSDAATHFAEAEMIAEIYGKHIISPFFAPDIITLSTTITNHEYFGTTYVKPILRELACEYFDRELIYQKKHGFPVPFISWLNGPLKHLVEEVKQERQLFNGSQLEHLNIEENFEIIWLLINWKIIHQHFQQSKIVSRHVDNDLEKFS